MGNLGIEGKISSVFIPMETHSHIKSSYCDCISPFGCAVILKLGYFIGGTRFFFMELIYGLFYGNFLTK